jgi:hypothetical protein
MGSSTIVLTVRWSSGGSQIVHAQRHSFIDEVLSSYGFSAGPRTVLFVAHKGKFIDPLFSFGYYNISSGDTLVCHTKAFPYKCDRLYEPRLSPRFTARARRSECLNTRMEDQVFTQLEMAQEFPSVMMDLLKQGERFDITGQFHHPFATIVPLIPTINETPMPALWQGS